MSKYKWFCFTVCIIYLLICTCTYVVSFLVGKPYLVERSALEWNGKIGDECEWGILEEAHLQLINKGGWHTSMEKWL